MMMRTEREKLQHKTELTETTDSARLYIQFGFWFWRWNILSVHGISNTNFLGRMRFSHHEKYQRCVVVFTHYPLS